MRRLKILHTITWFAKGGGVDQNVLLTIRHTKKDYEVHLTVGKERYHQAFEQEGIPIHYCDYLLRRIHPWYDLKALIYYYRLLKRERYDMVHTHESKSSLIVRVAAWLAGVPCIIYGLHGVPFNDPVSRFKRMLYYWAERLTFFMVDAIVAVSYDCKKIYHQKKLGLRKPWYVVRSGIETEKFIAQSEAARKQKQQWRAKIKVPEQAYLIINIGRFSWAKAQRYTIAAFAKIHQQLPQSYLLLIGDGPLLQDCQQQAKQLGIEKRVIFLGYSDEVPQWLAVSDLFLFTSLREGLPRVLVEAALCKVPIVTFEVEGVREILPSEEHGIIVPKYDIALMAQKAVTLLKAPKKRQAMAQKAFDHVRLEWDYRKMIQQLKAIYEHFAKGIL